MYTIIINKDKSLTTSIRQSLLRGTTSDEIVFLIEPPDAPEDDLDDNVTITSKTTYTPLLRYVVNSDGVTKTEPLAVDEELYKDRARFTVPRSSAFFRNRGSIELWLDITADTEITTTTTTIDEETGEEIIQTVTETSTESFSTFSTILFIDEIPNYNKCPYHCGSDNVIRITRGDSLSVNIILTDSDGYEYEPVDGDEVWFRVKKSAKADDVLIEKQIDLESMALELVEDDTRELAFGEYRYEIECITAEQDHYTVIKNAPFIITEELH